MQPITNELLAQYHRDVAAGLRAGRDPHGDILVWLREREAGVAAPAPGAAAPAAPAQPGPDFAALWARAIQREARALGLR
ncbi:hypothetical protein [Methylocystis echinoides]|uniref:Uncharacterized protein n=1 Tax=Methylocystis echinoides TaxID=29468 RepID=A0A9W6LSP2_9HYPH|nr:hypothetical protein [Methylocystis echinoides]GLI93666.1 hypothetical protein LMG27198_26580 [Methylocystis echinoides]